MPKTECITTTQVDMHFSIAGSAKNKIATIQHTRILSQGAPDQTILNRGKNLAKDWSIILYSPKSHYFVVASTGMDDNNE